MISRVPLNQRTAVNHMDTSLLRTAKNGETACLITKSFMLCGIFYSRHIKAVTAVDNLAKNADTYTQIVDECYLNIS